MSANTLSEYVKRGTERHSDLAEVMERRKNSKAQELENLEFDALIAEQKKKLKEATPITIDSSQITNFAASLFAGRTPAEIKEIMSSFNQEEMDKYLYLSGRGNSNSFVNTRSIPHESNTEVKNMLEALKIGLEAGRNKNDGNGVDMKGIAEIFKAGVEAARVPQSANPQPDLQYKMVENTLAELKAVREETIRQDRLRTEREIEALKNRPSGFDELVYNEEKAAKVRKIFGGADAGATNEFTLRKNEMDQTERLETKKLDWEMKKWELEKDKEGNTLETVKEILSGPVGEIVKNFGAAGADRLRGAKTPISNGQVQSSQIAQVKCPNCAGDFSANTQLSQIQCPLCGVLLQSGNQAAHEQTDHQDTIQVQEQATPISTSVSAQPQSFPETAPVKEQIKDVPVEVDSPVEHITAQSI